MKMNSGTSVCLVAAIVAFLWAAAPVCAQDSAQDSKTKCDWPAFERSAAQMRAARDAAMKVSEDEGNTEVPPEAIKQIQEFKNDLYAALQSYFLCQPDRIPDPQAEAKDLYARLGIPVPPPPERQTTDKVEGSGPGTGLYLADLTFKVETVPDSRKLIAVLTTFGIPYGEDAELDIFARVEGGRWGPVVHFTSTPYNSIAGAFEAFDYKISPADRKASWYILATHINPWPTSCWRSLFVDAVRPGEIGRGYQLFHSEEGGYVCDDVPPYIRRVSADGFQIWFSIESIDESQLSSVSVMTYRVEGDEVIRVQPVAFGPENFVDEWVHRTWQEAQGWSAPESLADLHEQHSMLHKSGFGDFVALRSCNVASLSEVEWVENSFKGPRRFFLVRKIGDDFTMLRVGDRATPACKGPNHLNSGKEQ